MTTPAFGSAPIRLAVTEKAAGVRGAAALGLEVYGDLVETSVLDGRGIPLSLTGPRSTYVIGILLCALALYMFREFRVTRLRSELLTAIAVFVGALYVLLVPVAERGGNRAGLDLIAAALVIILLGIGIAWSMTLESGIVSERWRHTSLLSLLLGPPRPATWVPPRMSRRKGILIAGLIIVFGVLHHLFFPWARLFYSTLFLSIGISTLLLSVLKLKKPEKHPGPKSRCLE